MSVATYGQRDSRKQINCRYSKSTRGFMIPSLAALSTVSFPVILTRLVAR